MLYKSAVIKLQFCNLPAKKDKPIYFDKLRAIKKKNNCFFFIKTRQSFNSVLSLFQLPVHFTRLCQTSSQPGCNVAFHISFIFNTWQFSFFNSTLFLRSDKTFFFHRLQKNFCFINWIKKSANIYFQKFFWRAED